MKKLHAGKNIVAGLLGEGGPTLGGPGNIITPRNNEGQDGSGIYEVNIDGTIHTFEAKVGPNEAPSSIWIYTNEQGIKDINSTIKPSVSTSVSSILSNGPNRNGRRNVQIQIRAQRKLIGIHALMPTDMLMIKDTLVITDNVECLSRNGKCRGDFVISSDDGNIRETIKYQIFDESSCGKVTTYWAAPGTLSKEGNIIMEYGRGI